MYDLRHAKIDFPWTRVRSSLVEPWREGDEGWFDYGIPIGWGDVIHKGLSKIDKILESFDAKDKIVLAQVKEKFGMLRVYFDMFDSDGEPVYSPDECYIAVAKEVRAMEDETARVCCDCGSEIDVRCYGGWVHYACEKCEDKRNEDAKNR